MKIYGEAGKDFGTCHLERNVISTNKEKISIIVELHKPLNEKGG